MSLFIVIMSLNRKFYAENWISSDFVGDSHSQWLLAPFAWWHTAASLWAIKKLLTVTLGSSAPNSKSLGHVLDTWAGFGRALFQFINNFFVCRNNSNQTAARQRRQQTGDCLGMFECSLLCVSAPAAITIAIKSRAPRLHTVHSGFLIIELRLHQIMPWIWIANRMRNFSQTTNEKQKERKIRCRKTQMQRRA